MIPSLCLNAIGEGSGSDVFLGVQAEKNLTTLIVQLDDSNRICYYVQFQATVALSKRSLEFSPNISPGVYRSNVPNCLITIVSFKLGDTGLDLKFIRDNGTQHSVLDEVAIQFQNNTITGSQVRFGMNELNLKLQPDSHYQSSQDSLITSSNDPSVSLGVQNMQAKMFNVNGQEKKKSGGYGFDFDDISSAGVTGGGLLTAGSGAFFAKKGRDSYMTKKQAKKLARLLSKGDDSEESGDYGSFNDSDEAERIKTDENSSSEDEKKSLLSGSSFNLYNATNNLERMKKFAAKFERK
ncbi:hypothetical protein HDE_09841 [Halotydeus destructor]|nr:hypothetical protein HDE_09841 [Halotydeus destructor]